MRQGAKIRGTYIKHAKTERKRLEDDLAKKRVEVAEKEGEVERLRISLEGLEAKSHEELERRKQSCTFLHCSPISCPSWPRPGWRFGLSLDIREYSANKL